MSDTISGAPTSGVPAHVVPTLSTALVLSTTEDICTVREAAAVLRARYAPGFPSPRCERVSPGHLVALARADDGAAAVLWRWYDAVVVEPVVEPVDAGLVRIWEPAHGEVLARRRPSCASLRPGHRAYASAGLPGADWWVADHVEGDDPAVELDEVAALYSDNGLWEAALAAPGISSRRTTPAP